MKRITAIICGLAFLFVLAGCDPATYSFYYDEYKDAIQAVDLIYYINTDIRPAREEDMQPYDFEKEERIDSLPEEQIDAFAKDFEDLRIIHDEPFAVNPMGVCLKVSLTDGEFIIVSDYKLEDGRIYCSYIARCNAEGSILQNYGRHGNRRSYMYLINKYFGMEI